MPALKQCLFHLVHKGFILLVIAVSPGALCAPAQCLAQDYPVAVVETGKTPGFDPPVLYLTARRLVSNLAHNRTLHEPYLINQDEDCGEVGAPINRAFMVNMIRSHVEAFNRFADSRDGSERPSGGCAWQLKIFHPGSSPGKILPEAAPCHIIVFCIGATGSTPALYNAMDWLGNYYAQRGYIVAIPVFIGNDDGLTGLPFYEITPDIYSMQVSQAIDYIRASFKGTLKKAVNSKHVTVIGHSFGGFVAQKTAALDRRVARLCILSSVFGYQQYWPGFILDTVDTIDLLNRRPKRRAMALHVQRFTKPPYDLPCPDFDPECDWIPPVDGFITQVDLSADPWEPHFCNGENCGVRDGTLYNYALYEGPKQDGIRNNILLNHSGLVDPADENDAGRDLILQNLDEFFSQYPLD